MPKLFSRRCSKSSFSVDRVISQIIGQVDFSCPPWYHLSLFLSYSLSLSLAWLFAHSQSSPLSLSSSLSRSNIDCFNTFENIKNTLVNISFSFSVFWKERSLQKMSLSRKLRWRHLVKIFGNFFAEKVGKWVRLVPLITHQTSSAILPTVLVKTCDDRTSISSWDRFSVMPS